MTGGTFGTVADITPTDGAGNSDRHPYREADRERETEKIITSSKYTCGFLPQGEPYPAYGLGCPFLPWGDFLILTGSVSDIGRFRINVLRVNRNAPPNARIGMPSNWDTMFLDPAPWLMLNQQTSRMTNPAMPTKPAMKAYSNGSFFGPVFIVLLPF
jgi:hypothetical protein